MIEQKVEKYNSYCAKYFLENENKKEADYDFLNNMFSNSDLEISCTSFDTTTIYGS
jgi:hypothetical protein